MELEEEDWSQQQIEAEDIPGISMAEIDRIGEDAIADRWPGVDATGDLAEWDRTATDDSVAQYRPGDGEYGFGELDDDAVATRWFEDMGDWRETDDAVAHQREGDEFDAVGWAVGSEGAERPFTDENLAGSIDRFDDPLGVRGLFGDDDGGVPTGLANALAGRRILGDDVAYNWRGGEDEPGSAPAEDLATRMVGDEHPAFSQQILKEDRLNHSEARPFGESAVSEIDPGELADNRSNDPGFEWGQDLFGDDYGQVADSLAMHLVM